MTFKVLWSFKETTLKEFEDFLNEFFHKHRIHISLRTVRQSLLTFVCTIPRWFVEEMISFVGDNKDGLKLNGIIEITVDSTIITIDPKLVSDKTSTWC